MLSDILLQVTTDYVIYRNVWSVFPELWRKNVQYIQENMV
jgi:hypothetical protein